MTRKRVEVEEDGTPYDVVCEHGVHFGGYRCWVCHPELLPSSHWLFTPEMDEAYAIFKSQEVTPGEND